MAIDFTDFRAQLAELHTPVESVYRRSFPVGTAHLTSVNPNDTTPLQCGEFVRLSSDGKSVERGGDAVGGAGNEIGPGDGGAVVNASAATARPEPCFMVWYEVGATDSQVNGQVPILFMGSYEVDTEIFVDDALAIGKEVYVVNVQHPRRTAVSADNLLRGLASDDHGGAGAGAGGAGMPVGFITKLPADNGGKLRVLVHRT